MESTYAALGNPSYGFFAMLFIGALAGWIAERVTNSSHGLFTNILVGLAGSFIGGKLAEMLEIPIFGFFRTLVAAIVGAVLLVWIWNAVRSPRSGST